LSLPNGTEQKKKASTIDKAVAIGLILFVALAISGILLLKYKTGIVSYNLEVTASIYTHPRWNLTLNINENITTPLTSYELIYKRNILQQQNLTSFQMNKGDTITFSFLFENHIPEGTQFTVILVFSDNSYMPIDLASPKEATK